MTRTRQNPQTPSCFVSRTNQSFSSERHHHIRQDLIALQPPSSFLGLGLHHITSQHNHPSPSPYGSDSPASSAASCRLSSTLPGVLALLSCFALRISLAFAHQNLTRHHSSTSHKKGEGRKRRTHQQPDNTTSSPPPPPPAPPASQSPSQ